MLPRAVILMISLFGLSIRAALADDEIERIYSDEDQSSCICGLNKEMLDRLESIFRAANSDCKASNLTEIDASSVVPSSSSSNEENDPPAEEQLIPPPRPVRDPHAELGGQPVGQGSDQSGEASEQQQQPSPQEEHKQPQNQESTSQESGNPSELVGGSSAQSTVLQPDNTNTLQLLAEEIKNLQAQLAHLVQPQPSINTLNPATNLVTSQPIPPVTVSPIQPPSVAPVNLSGLTASRPISSGQEGRPGSSTQSEQQGSGTVSLDSARGEENNPRKDNGQIISSGILQGLPKDPSASSNEALAKLNHSSQVEPSEMQTALESTVPNVVSNIFSNIQNVSLQAESSPPSQQSTTLTSIDGSSVVANGNTADEITAQGEKLFITWIENQLHNLELTASVAAYIRKSAINLFRKILKQYVDRLQLLGGHAQDNVRRGVQLALNSTEVITSFLLKNYINFAGGLMQIIGEQVSRVGKQLDSTGTSIAKINLNPFEIVSDVLGSLPNPSRYSEYFRAFGKYLMGGSSSQEQQVAQPQQQQLYEQQPQHTDMPHGLFSKTMGALGKRFQSWLGR